MLDSNNLNKICFIDQQINPKKMQKRKKND